MDLDKKFDWRKMIDVDLPRVGPITKEIRRNTIRYSNPCLSDEDVLRIEEEREREFRERIVHIDKSHNQRMIMCGNLIQKIGYSFKHISLSFFSRDYRRVKGLGYEA